MHRSLRRAAGALALLALAAVPPAAASAAPTKTKTKTKAHYLLSLGDSLSVGVQPNAAGQSLPTAQGYADQLYALEKPKVKNLKLVKLGCGGETSGSMSTGTGNVTGKECSYAKHNQLDQALAFIKAHHAAGEISLITIDLGANDVDSCLTPTGSIDLTCVTTGENALFANLPKIVSKLRKAAGKKVTMAGMTYYDPFLAGYLVPSTRALATLSISLAGSLNAQLTKIYQAQKFKIADVAAAFKTADMTDLGTFAGQSLPIDVANICNDTWMCVPAPQGPNIHANQTGYALIAQTFAAAVGKL